MPVGRLGSYSAATNYTTTTRHSSPCQTATERKEKETAPLDSTCTHRHTQTHNALCCISSRDDLIKRFETSRPRSAFRTSAAAVAGHGASLTAHRLIDDCRRALRFGLQCRRSFRMYPTAIEMPHADCRHHRVNTDETTATMDCQ